MEAKYSNNIQTVIADSIEDCIGNIKKVYGNRYYLQELKTVKKTGLSGLFGRKEVQATFIAIEKQNSF